MGDPLAWHNLVFYIPLIAGLLLVIGAAWSGGGHGHDHDAHAGEHASHPLAILGVGRVPLLVALLITFLVFGGVGVIATNVLAAFGLGSSLTGVLAIVVALLATLLGAGRIARALDRRFPATETYRVARTDFIGCTGTLLLPADPQNGLAQVKDPEGNVHNIKCRTARAALAKGTAILIVDYDEAARTFLVDVQPSV
jgi:membrane protein implicated in regulation of membrane protease activity